MSSRMHSTVKWDSSEEEEDEEEDTFDRKFRMKLREGLKHNHPVESSANELEVAEPRRRGRGPSKRPCLNRNALMARENRQRKKAYLEKIENKLSFYQEENKTLVNTIRKQNIDIKRLTAEVAYLKSVLNNNTNIAALLKTINDGLRKIGACKKLNSFRSDDVSRKYPDPDSSEVQTKCTNVKNNNRNSKENGLKLEYCDVPHDSSGEDFLDYRSTCGSLKNPTLSVNHHDLDTKEGSSLATTVSSLSQESNDTYMDSMSDVRSLLPMENLISIGEKKDLDTLSADFDQLPMLNLEMFDDLPKCDDIMSIDGLHDSSNLFVEDDMFPCLDNTGICLHVNSDKISLEYCSLCCSNSKNLSLN